MTDSTELSMMEPVQLHPGPLADARGSVNHAECGS
jgi:hypothetical protein